MKILHFVAGAIALACAPNAALAQSQVGILPSIVPSVVIATGAPGAPVVPVSATSPLPVSVTNAAATQKVEGTVASAAADSGNPVKIGGVYSSVSNLSERTAGQRSDAQMDRYGNLRAEIVGVRSVVTDAGSTIVYPSSSGSNAQSTGAGGDKAPLGVANFLWTGTNIVAARGDTTGAYVIGKGGSAIPTGQVSVGTTSTLVLAARTGRQKVMLAVGAANACAFGASGITLSTGFPLQPVAGATITIDTAAAVYAACSATTTISYLEQF